MRDATGAVQSALVLGGTSEIAQAIVRALAPRLRHVTLAARDVERARAFALPGVAIEVVPFEAADTATHAALVERAFEREVDLVLVAHGVLATELETAVDTIGVNFTGAVSAIVPAVEALRRQGHGTLVVLSSVAGERPRASNFVYGATKAGLDAFAQGLGDALAGSGVRVLVVRPGFVRTKMTEGLEPAPLSVDPGAVADAVVRGLARGAHTVWAPPALRWVMLALRLVPRPLFRRLPL